MATLKVAESPGAEGVQPAVSAGISGAIVVSVDP